MIPSIINSIIIKFHKKDVKTVFWILLFFFLLKLSHQDYEVIKSLILMVEYVKPLVVPFWALSEDFDFAKSIIITGC